MLRNSSREELFRKILRLLITRKIRFFEKSHDKNYISSPDFSIDPAVGYLSPGMEQPLNITFHPKTISNDIRYPRVPCIIEGAKV